jgi:hypothetical protein
MTSHLTLVIRQSSLALVFWICSSGVHSGNAQPRPFELISNGCAVMQDFLNGLAVDYANPNRTHRKTDEEIDQSLLHKLERAKFEEVEELFRCFQFEDGTPQLTSEEVRSGVVRKIVTTILIARIRYPRTPERKEFVDIPVYTRFIVAKNKDGSSLSSGKYFILY